LGLIKLGKRFGKVSVGHPVSKKNNLEEWCRSCRVCLARSGPTGKEKRENSLTNL